MSATPAAMQFDTLDYARKLESAGVPNAQAEAHARALGEALGSAVAYRGDLFTLETSLTSKLAALGTRLDARIDAFENHLAAVESRLDASIDSVRNELKLHLGGKIETLKWMFGVLVALNVGILIRVLAIH